MKFVFVYNDVLQLLIFEGAQMVGLKSISQPNIIITLCVYYNLY